ncbi:MAG: hypothetical protein II319_04800 [Clostridia bacterium]|nr:hypothetical protein [Clostridia bacterium]
MKTPRIANAVGLIDDDLVIGAAEYKKTNRNKTVIKWVLIAACFSIAVLAAIPFLSIWNGKGSPGGKPSLIYGQESGFIWPWEYRTESEKYAVYIYNMTDYTPRGEIGADKVGEEIGTCMGMGTDPYTDKVHTKNLKVHKINGISEDRLIAVEIEGSFYVCFNMKAEVPATFGEVLDLYNLAEVLPFTKFSVYEGYKQKDYFKIADDTYIRQILSECRDAKVYENPDSWSRDGRDYLSFTATSEELGVYKKAVYITEDGYVWTNIFEYAYVYFIGEEAAGKIIGYAKNNAEKSESEPYNYTLAGTLTEIGDGYLLVDDTVLCDNQSDGKVWRVLTDDLRLRRCYEVGNIKVGDVVVITYRTPVAEGSDTITDAFDMQKGVLIENEVAVPE